MASNSITNRQLMNLLQIFLSLRGFAILMVIMAHVAISFIAAECHFNPEKGLTPLVFNYWQLISPNNFFILEISRAAVPLFLFFAGYHLARSLQTWKSIWNNTKNVLIPMLFWGFISWGISWRKGVNGYSIEQFLYLLITGKIQLGYYFIILIVQFFILSKWIIVLIREKPFLAITGAAAIQLSTHIYDYVIFANKLSIIQGFHWGDNYGLFPECLFPRFILSFSIGAWASLNLNRFKRITDERFLLLGFLSLLGTLMLMLETGIIFGYSLNTLNVNAFEAASNAWGEWKITTALWSIVAILLIISVFRRIIPFKKTLEVYGKHSYQILLLHGMIINFLQLFCYKYVTSLQWFGKIGFLIWLFLTLCFSMVAIKVIRRIKVKWIQQLILGY